MARTTPKEVLDFADKNADGHQKYVQSLEIVNDMPCLCTYLVQIIKKKLMIQEFHREPLFGNSKCSENLWENIWSIRGILTSEKAARNHYGLSFDPKWKLYTCRDKNDHFFTCYTVYDEGTAFAVLCRYIPHFYIDKFTFDKFFANGGLMRYARMYSKNRNAEILAKSGFGYMLTDSRMLNMGKNLYRKVLSYLKTNGEFVKQNKVTLSEIIILTKHPELTLESYRKNRYVNPETIIINNYLEKQGEKRAFYNDYIRLAHMLGYNTKAKSVLFPKHLSSAHDKASNAIVVKERKSINPRLAKIANKFKKALATIDGYTFSFPKSVSEVSEQADQLYQCLIKCEYDKRVADGKELLVFIHKNGKPVATAELMPAKNGTFSNLNQFYSNHDNLPSEEVKNAFGKWFKTVYKPSLEAMA